VPAGLTGLTGLTGRSERADGDGEGDLLAGDGDLLAGDDPAGAAGLAEVERADPGAPVPLSSRFEPQRDTNS
jgi:hypothetical protein